MADTSPMRTVTIVCVLLAGCGREPAATTPPQPKAEATVPLPGPIGIGEQLKADLRRQNAAQQVRRAAIETAGEAK